MTNATKINTYIIMDIHAGLNTHNHDHLMTPVSLSVIKTTCNKPVNPTPPFTVVLLSFIASPFLCPSSAPTIKAFYISDVMSVNLAYVSYICALWHYFIMLAIATDSVFPFVSAIYDHCFSFQLLRFLQLLISCPFSPIAESIARLFHISELASHSAISIVIPILTLPTSYDVD